MPIVNPNQYQIDNMDDLDTLYITHRNFLYRFIRTHFLKNKPKLKITSINNDEEETTYEYQEDCTIFYLQDLKGIQQLKKKVIYNFRFGKTNLFCNYFDNVLVGFNNIQFIFKNGFNIAIPTNIIYDAINKNIQTIKDIDNQYLVRQQVKFLKYKGDYYKEYVHKHNIKSWVAQYCPNCGEAVKFEFSEDDIKIINECICGYLKPDIKQMNYNSFAIWMASQVDPYIQKRYSEFWFKKE